MMSVGTVVVFVFVFGLLADVIVAMRAPWWRSIWSLCYAGFFILLSFGYGTACIVWSWYWLGLLYYAYSILMIGTLARILARNRAHVDPRIVHPSRPVEAEEGEQGSVSVEWALLMVFLIAIIVAFAAMAGVGDVVPDVRRELVIR